jgi:glyoxylase-like metal-dependent hydrolase (beta-lactamase superfamily II)
MNPRTRNALILAAVAAAAAVPFACASLPTLPPQSWSTPPSSDAALQVCWLELGGTEVSAGLGAAGVTTAPSWQVTTSALLVRHPRGDLLIDTGIAVNAQEQSHELGAWRRFVFGQTAGRNVPRGTLSTLLDGLGARTPLAILISHAHADHLGGVAQLPGTPVWLAAEELAFIADDVASHRGVVMPAQARALEGRSVALRFDSGPYLNFPRSHDVFGDGAVVVVPTFGHTPGSIATFVNLPGHRFVHVGDLINLEESITRAVPKSALMRALTDEDAAQTGEQVARLVELHAREPSVQILPAHDRRAWERLFGPSPIDAAPPCVGAQGEIPPHL